MKDQKGMFENVDSELYNFIYDNSESICPEGKYDKTMSCSHSSLIRFVNPILNQNKKQIEEYNELLETHEQIKQQNIDVHDEWKELKKENKELIEALGKLMRSMLAHPDCVEGSEFDDFTSMANDLILKNTKK